TAGARRRDDGSHGRAHELRRRETGFGERPPGAGVSEAFRAAAAEDRHHPGHPAHLVRNAECGVRNVTVRPVRRYLPLQLRIPHSTLRTHSPAPASYLRSMTREARRFDARS